MEEADHRSQNPYTELEGYALVDASGAEVGKVEETVYDAVGGVLKYLSVNGRAVLADRIEVDPKAERIRVPYRKEAVESAPALEDPSGEFDRTLRSHYEEDDPAEG